MKARRVVFFFRVVSCDFVDKFFPPAQPHLCPTVSKRLCPTVFPTTARAAQQKTPRRGVERFSARAQRIHARQRERDPHEVARAPGLQRGGRFPNHLLRRAFVEGARGFASAFVARFYRARQTKPLGTVQSSRAPVPPLRAERELSRRWSRLT